MNLFSLPWHTTTRNRNQPCSPLPTTRALLEDLPLRWSVKTGMATPRGVVPGLRLVPPTAWSPVPVSSLQADTRHSSDGRFVIVHGRFV